MYVIVKPNDWLFFYMFKRVYFTSLQPNLGIPFGFGKFDLIEDLNIKSKKCPKCPACEHKFFELVHNEYYLY